MSVTFRAFIPGEGEMHDLPLARFLPPLPDGMVSAWLQQDVPAGAWLLDPIASTPRLALEAARAGYRVLVVSNNPILSFILEILAQAPTTADFQAAISELASSRRGEERIEAHFKSLYQTECPNCGRRIAAKAFIWRKDEPLPVKREVSCPYCKADGEFTVTALDLERLNLPGNPNLHQARALERISAPQDETREGAVEALRSYLPRPLYFITTLVNKIEGLAVSPERRLLLQALALSVCDKANALWPHPGGRSRPRQLTTPPEFREDNLWNAFEQAVVEWAGQPKPVALTHWPDLPPESGGICLFTGRLRQLLPLPSELTMHSAMAVLPRPNQAFWTLSAIWSGWLWGREAVKPLSSALERRRYDWQWHTTALHSAFSTLHRHVPEGFALHGWLPELVPGFLAAAMVAAEAAGFELNQAALAPEPEFAQVRWVASAAGKASASSRSPQRVIAEAVSAHLAERNEPSLYLPIYTAGMAALAENHLLPSHQGQLSYDTLSRIQGMVSTAFIDQTQFRRFDSRLKNIESGWWWLTQPPASAEPPLADRVEMEVVKALIRRGPIHPVELMGELAEIFPGLLTPSMELIRECLESYAEMDQSSPPRWQLKATEQPATRRNDLRAVQVGLLRLGKRLGLRAEGEFPVRWQAASGEAVLFLYPVVSGVISRALLMPEGAPERCVLVLPGSRSRLITYKMRRDPRLSAAAVAGWRFLKFRLLRDLLMRADLDEALFFELLASDPPTLEDATQMSFF